VVSWRGCAARAAGWPIIAYGDELNSYVGQRMLELMRAGGDTSDSSGSGRCRGPPPTTRRGFVIGRGAHGGFCDERAADRREGKHRAAGLARAPHHGDGLGETDRAGFARQSPTC